jgi:hypothetical protein
VLWSTCTWEVWITGGKGDGKGGGHNVLGLMKQAKEYWAAGHPSRTHYVRNGRTFRSRFHFSQALCTGSSVRILRMRSISSFELISSLNYSIQH